MTGSTSPGEAAGTRSYKDTLNLPRTAFAMKANLVQNEPASLKRWENAGLYGRVRAKKKGARVFCFHDGPPYANGSIHLGHLMNKCLKDFVVRSKGMMGFDVPYVPGWDCHGLPIEHKVMTELHESGKAAKLATLEPAAARMAIRRECKKYAEKYIKLQGGQMKRLLTLADYDNPYLTMQASYEGAVLEVLAGLIAEGLVYRALKPVHWSIANETALAEAELEYEDREDISVFVDFEAADASAVYAAFGFEVARLAEPGEENRVARIAGPGGEGDTARRAVPPAEGVPPAGGVPPGQTPSFMIWTTTPWTLPANLAIAVHPEIRYALVRIDGNITVLAERLIGAVTEAAKSEDVEVLATTTGASLVGLRYRHPFIGEAPRPHGKPDADTGRCYTVVAAEYVTLEDGTGLVHTAPGHGVEDYQTGLREGLPVYCPVKGDGTYDHTVPEWLHDKSVWEANELVTARLRESGHLFHSNRFMHSYPHDWRSKTPVIFRCTEQWFVGVQPDRTCDERAFLPAKYRLKTNDTEGLTLKEAALLAIGAVNSARLLYRNRIKDRDLNCPNPVKQRELPTEWITELAGENAAAEFAKISPAVDRPIDRESMFGSESDARPPLEQTTGMSLRGTAPCVNFVPEWGRNRMRGMLESRPDWCISRQRSWGLPIPAFHTADGSAFMTEASVRAVAKVFREEGSDAWFLKEPAELLRHYKPEDDPAAPDHLDLALLKKGGDILDVWFESGSSWNAVMRERLGEAGFPVELYLEGSDQHRGWFQLSLLPALGVMGRPPFKTLLTHGFMVDKDGRKLSKSAGHTIENLFEQYGADVLRWWVSSLAYEGDVKVDDSFFALAGESYRKVRNTVRFLLSNLSDFDRGAHGVEVRGMDPACLDAWALAAFDRLASEVKQAYDAYNFRRANALLYDFCNDTLSAVYLAATKDRLYCDASDSPRRHRTQTVMWDLADGLCRLLAPILCHTADEAFRELRGDPEACVHLEEFPEASGVTADAGWASAIAAREAGLLALEKAKAEQGIDNPLDAGLVFPDPEGVLARFDPVDLADLCGVSRAAVDAGATAVAVQDLRDEPRCERSRKRDGTVRQRSDGGWLTDRDAAVVGV